MSELEVTFVTSSQGVDVILEADKRGGVFTEGRDVYHAFQVPHATAAQTDWAGVIDQWLRGSVLSRSGFFGH
jgi:sporulation-control protein